MIVGRRRMNGDFPANRRFEPLLFLKVVDTWVIEVTALMGKGPLMEWGSRISYLLPAYLLRLALKQLGILIPP